jgi:ectoine hydroxylase-related dioxygenase (phytanoyl-CoA dioxygenase family)
MTQPPSYCSQVIEDGFAIVPCVLSTEGIAELIAAFEKIGQDSAIQRRGGIRNLLEAAPEALELAESKPVRAMVDAILGGQAFPVRGILFDKTPEANWKVPWHQDVTIAVASREEIDGFGPWSVKAGGVLHVQPPAHILENMLSVRIHLDPCGEENGALKILPGSHRLGRLPEAEAIRLGAENPPIVCAANAGDAVLMRPLLLHSSSASDSPSHRRVIHLDFAAAQLPLPLRWAVN